MTSAKEDASFLKEVVMQAFPDNFLQNALQWVVNNMCPEDVFSEKELSEWARSSGFVKNGETP